MAKTHAGAVRRYRTSDPAVEAAIDALLALRAGHPDADLVREMIVTCVKLLDDRAARGDLRLYRTALKEMRYANKVFAPYRGVPKATIFGSARLSPTDPSYRQAVEFSRRIAEAGWMVITGAGPGVMQAGNEGAGPERSFGVNIRLPYEQRANPLIHGNPRLITFKYFFTRKLFFVKESRAVVLFPGGFGTLDEGLEALTLLQTGKTEPRPVVLLDDPGADYWQSIDAFFRGELQRRGLIAEEDVRLYRVTDSVDEAMAEILGFYSNYHSARHMQQGYVMRLRRPPSADALAEIRRDFRWLLQGLEGDFRVVEGPVRGEGPDGADEASWRLVFPFDRRSYGRLRLLIDRINTW